MNKKRALILTHKLGYNYGGIMQAYALQEALRNLEVDPTTTSFEYERLKSKLGRPVKQFLRRLIHIVRPTVSDLPIEYNSLIDRNTQIFINKYVQTISNKKVLSEPVDQKYDVLISGSDQVWRSAYVPVARYLFDFADGQQITRLSYAASFGKDDLLEYSPELLTQSKRLAQQFDAISVREDSGIELVKKHWQMDAECHVDPTLLFDKAHYEELVKDSEIGGMKKEGNLFAYVLDRNGVKGEIIDRVAKELKLQDFEIYPPKAKDRKEFYSDPEKFQLPPVEQWLKGFMDAEFVITDSFHGTAFSIIFNKPFLAIGNKDRGLARFLSVLKLFGLEDRLITDTSQVSAELLKKKIDWDKVNSIRNSEAIRSLNFLKSNLGLK